jgi:hypothetical protein
MKGINNQNIKRAQKTNLSKNHNPLNKGKINGTDNSQKKSTNGQ